MSKQLSCQSAAYCSIVIVNPSAKVMTIKPASGAFMIKSVFLGERLVEIQRIGTFVRTRKSFVQTIQPAKEALRGVSWFRKPRVRFLTNFEKAL